MKSWTVGAFGIGVALLVAWWALRTDEVPSDVAWTPSVAQEPAAAPHAEPASVPDAPAPEPLLADDARDASPTPDDSATPPAVRPPLDVFALTDDLHRVAYDLVHGDADADALFTLAEDLVAQLADGRAPDRVEHGAAVYELALAGSDSVTLRAWDGSDASHGDFSLSAKLGTSPGVLSGIASDGSREARLEMQISVDAHGVPVSMGSSVQTSPSLTPEFRDFLTSSERAAPIGATLRVTRDGSEWRSITMRATVTDGEPSTLSSIGDPQVVPGSLADPRAAAIARALERTRPAVDGH